MRSWMLLLVMAMTAGHLHGQQRFLVAPNSEVIPLSPQESSAEAIKASQARAVSSAATCPDQFMFGYPADDYTVNSNFGAYHRDVLGQWFVAPASGTVDSIFWFNRASVGAYDSTIYLRVHSSNIGPSYGPGVRPGPFAPPCQNWGYWTNSNDLDRGVAAFREEATETTWVSTINGAAEPSGPPFGAELWGLGGYPVRIRPNSVGCVAMSDLALPIAVSAGDKFFVSMRVAHEQDSLGGHKEEGTEEARTEWNASGFAVGSHDPDYPSRNWKFYEHDKGPSSCSGVPIDSIRRGWVARGGFGADSLTVAAYNIWYVMTVVSNTPPTISDPSGTVHVALCCDLPGVEVEITDCNAADPSQAGVDSAFLIYSLEGVRQPDIAMVNDYGNIWRGELPEFRVDTTIEYRVRAVDKDGAVGFSGPRPYRMVGLGNDWYAVDTSAACGAQDVSATGVTIPRGTFFGPPSPSADFDPLDGGTAGPFDLGGAYVVFGDTFRYAWVGIDGAIALSQRTSDTLDVSANGSYALAWDFPTASASAFDRGRALPGMPRMMIAPLYRDLFLSGFAGGGGAIRYGNDDPCAFIVAWDSVGDRSGSGEGNTFRVILNRCDGSVTFQYGSIGPADVDSASLVGMQRDTDTYLFLNKQTHPMETAPRSGWCVTMRPASALSVTPEQLTPGGFSLAQNYPNPFNPVTTIDYAVPTASEVRLAVFNILGEQVASLVRGVESPGFKSVRFDAGNLPSGVYVYRLQAGNFSAVRKLLVLK